jgi:lipopolysaccharide biosynthesis regulator YciM
MFEEISPFYRATATKLAFGKPLENKNAETKKCQKCLRRVDLIYWRCPFCGCHDFQFNNS